MRRRQSVAYLLTAVGLLGTVLSLILARSDYDPVAFGTASVSVLVAIVGISLVLKEPARAPRRRDNHK